ncbi:MULTISPECIES: DUF3455 domain-containing protein [Streptomyces]|uniref:DUF3455 domain-containing protein n=1 Tax=Streptomyces griseoaurantiacus TaxID=68213 RepID=UPI002E34E09A|nr:DUF3455 domain-containing protein [Streptomyces jietaisiensis]WTI25674.1 DUF3455 domain-containing protein [Streptomyces jietaisiensis]
MKLATRLALTTTAVAAVAAGTFLGVTTGTAAATGTGTVPPVPSAVKVPDGNRLTGVFAAEGVQTYTCTDGAWKLLEPAATLSAAHDRSHRPVALHSRGPVWVSTVDGSAVNAASVASSPRDGAVDELLLRATATRGSGVFADVSYIQRLGTRGGLAPSAACSGGDQKSVPYTATYVFYKPSA